MRHYQTWAYLNSEGRQVWGDVFPDGKVPIQSIISLPASLEGIDAVQSIYLVDWKELTSQQQEAVLDKLSKKSGASKTQLLKDILKVGLPLRERYTEGCGTSRLELF